MSWFAVARIRKASLGAGQPAGSTTLSANNNVHAWPWWPEMDPWTVAPGSPRVHVRPAGTPARRSDGVSNMAKNKVGRQSKSIRVWHEPGRPLEEPIISRVCYRTALRGGTHAART